MRLLVTAGPTREHIDSVRFISNASSGRMAFAIAEEAKRRGHEVVLVCGPVALDPPAVEVVPVISAADMLEVCLGVFERCDAAVMAAAVSDWRPRVTHEGKLPKAQVGLSLELEPTTDVCAALGERKGGRVLVGFAVQDLDARTRAEEKMRRKHCDAIVLNGPGNIGSDAGQIEIKVVGEPWGSPVKGTKAAMGAAVVDVVESLLGRRKPA